MSAEVPDRQRLTDHMVRCQLELNETWKHIAERGGTSEPTLRRLRDQSSYSKPLTKRNKVSIERGLFWRPGAVDKVLEDPAYMPDGRPLTAYASVDEVVAYLSEMRAGRPQDYREVLHRLDIQR
jgi:hypothetical protein